MSDNDVKIKISLDGADTAEKGLRGVGDGASDSDSKLGKLASGGLKGVAVAGAALAAVTVAVGAGLWNIAKGAADAGDAIDENANKLGISYGAYQEWDYVLSQTGASIESLKGGMTRLNSAVDEASNGNQDAIDKFARLGISLDDLAGKSREDIFALTIEGLQGVEDAGERAAIATQLLGRGASELGGLLNTTSEDTAALKQQAIDLGLILSDEAVAAGDAFNDSLDTLQRTMTGVKNTIGAQLLPGLTEVTLGLSGLLVGTEGSEERIRAGAETLVTSISEVLPRILSVFSSILGGVAIIAPQIVSSLVEGVVSNLPSFITTLSGALVNLVTLVVAQLPGLVNSGVQAVLALASGISSALPTLIPVVIKGVLDVVKAVIQAAPMLIQAGLQLVNGLLAGVLAALPVIIAALPSLIEGIVSFIGEAVPMILDAGINLFMALIEALPTVIDQIVAILPTLITSIIGAVVGAIPLLIEAGIQLLMALVGGLPTIITSIVGALPVIITSIINAVLGAIPLLVQAGIDLLIALVQALPQIITTVVAAVPQIINSVLGALTDSIPEIIMAGVQLLVALVKNMPTIVATIVAAIPQIITGIVTALGEGISQVVQVGGNIVAGIWEGISGAAGWLYDQIAGFVEDVIDSIAEDFGIKSPSTRMRDEIGQYLPPGIGEGVEENEDKALDPIRDLNNKIMDEAGKLNTTASFDTNFTQTLVPLRSTPTPTGPISVEATLDPFLISAAIGDAFADFFQDQNQAPVVLSPESVDTLAAAIVDSVQLTSRQGVVALG